MIKYKSFCVPGTMGCDLQKSFLPFLSGTGKLEVTGAGYINSPRPVGLRHNSFFSKGRPLLRRTESCWYISNLEGRGFFFDLHPEELVGLPEVNLIIVWEGPLKAEPLRILTLSN